MDILASYFNQIILYINRTQLLRLIYDCIVNQPNFFCNIIPIQKIVIRLVKTIQTSSKPFYNTNKALPFGYSLFFVYGYFQHSVLFSSSVPSINTTLYLGFVRRIPSSVSIRQTGPSSPKW